MGVRGVENAGIVTGQDVAAGIQFSPTYMYIYR